MSGDIATGPASERPFTRARKGAVLFFLLGPLVGLLVFAAGSVVAMGDSRALGSVIFFPMAWVAGGVPAALTGITVGLLKNELHGRLRGYAISGVLGALWTGGLPLLIGHPDFSNVAIFTAVGGIAGWVCGWRFLRRPPAVGEVDRDSSFGARP